MLHRIAYSLHGVGLFQLISGLALLGWGLLLTVLEPGLLVEGHIYRAMAATAPAAAWGGFCLIVGAVQAAAVLCFLPRVMSFASVGGMLFFWSVAGAFFAVTPTTTGGITYFVLGFGNAVSAAIFWRAR